jgi:advillin
MASDKAVELDAALGSSTVQYRETQGEESDKFLSYFKPCVIPIQGRFFSHLKGSGDRSSATTMFRCQGEHVARVTQVRRDTISGFSFVSWCLLSADARQPVVFQILSQVPFSRSSLDHKSVFIVDTPSKLFLFSGCNSSMQTRAKALDVVKHLKENRHLGRCEIAAIGTAIDC